MVEEEKKKEIIERIKQNLVDYEEEEVAEACEESLKLGMDPLETILEGLAGGMEIVGELWEKNEYYVPEVLLCADAMYAGLDVLRPHIPEDKKRSLGTVIIGTVEGDVHDIGKNMVKMMFEVAGFDVIDLGKDVPLEKFVEEQLKTDSDIVCLSAMMTTTMTGMKSVIEKIKEKNPNCRIMIGGAPVSGETVDEYGADGYAEDSTNAVREAIEMISSLKEIDREIE